MTREVACIALLAKPDRQNLAEGFRCWATAHHAGLDYSGEDGTTETLHVGPSGHVLTEWHVGTVAAVIPVPLGPEQLKNCAFVAKLFASNYGGKQLPYSLPAPSTRIRMDGVFEQGPEHGGLTCSTFVLELLRTVTNRPVIAADAWGADEDALNAWVTSSSHDEQTRTRLKQAVKNGAIRVTPLEMLAACACSDWPVGDASLCRTKANELVDLLDGASI